MSAPTINTALATHSISVDREDTVTFDGTVIGSVAKVDRNTYDALDTDGNVIAANCYGNGGARGVAASYVASRTGYLTAGMRHTVTDERTGKVAGPYTFRASC